jgi:hypothetical protein
LLLSIDKAHKIRYSCARFEEKQMVETNPDFTEQNDQNDPYGAFADTDERLIEAAREVERARRDAPPAYTPIQWRPLTEAELHLR